MVMRMRRGCSVPGCNSSDAETFDFDTGICLFLCLFVKLIFRPMIALHFCKTQSYWGDINE